MNKLSTPSIPPLSLPVLIGAAAKAAETFGVFTLSEDQVQSLTELTYVLGGVFGLDVLLRAARAKFLGARIVQDAPLRAPAADGLQAGVVIEPIDDGGVTDDLLEEEPVPEGPHADEPPEKPAEFQ